MKVMIVDDSIVFRSGISQALSGASGMQVVKTASNGKIAVDFLKQNPDINLITLDLEMPIMNGIEAIKEIRTFNKTVKIIVFSAISESGAEQTLEALSLGADDFVTKVKAEAGTSIESSLELIRQNLLPKLEALTANNPEITSSIESDIIKRKINDIQPKIEQYSSENYLSEMPINPKLIIIGCSTGGPDALRKIFSQIKVMPTVPILIVQHMPPIFTDKLAKTLSGVSMVRVKEAEEGEYIKAGVAYIAPGDFHMSLDVSGNLKMDQNEKECFVRPSVNILFESVSKNFTDQVMTIVLTGMGEDGARGCELLKEKKSYLYIQNKETCAVWGMPGAVFSKNLGALSLPIEKIAGLIDSVANRA